MALLVAQEGGAILRRTVLSPSQVNNRVILQASRREAAYLRTRSPFTDPSTELIQVAASDFFEYVT